MIDIKLLTFIKLCDKMNYRITAEELHITQPAVTQHIKALESEYSCNLIKYDGRKLTITPEGEILRQYVREAICQERVMREIINKPEKQLLRIGATKTIGAYVCGEILNTFLSNPNNIADICVENTETLLGKLNNNELDFAMIEGFFDKERYGWRLMRKEPFVGVCAKNHRLAGTVCRLEDILTETLILREEGSGTRSILEQVLNEHNRDVDNFARTICINDFSLIEKMVSSGLGISFVYKAVADNYSELDTFKIENYDIMREFNYVYLKNTDMDKKIERIIGL